MKRVFGFFIIFFLSASSLSAQSIDDALKEYYSEKYSIAFSLFYPLATKGNAEAQFYVGQMYFEGTGISRDDANALLWFRRSANRDFARAQYALGFFYRTGRSVQQNDVQAARWIEKAARQGYQAAQYDLAGLYFAGIGVPKDPVKALMWRLIQPKRGDASAIDKIAFVKKMTKQQIEMARWSATVCRETDFKDCE